MLRLVTAAAFAAIAAIGPAFAVVDTTTGSMVDLAPILNPLIQGVGALLAALAVPAGIFFTNWIRSKASIAAVLLDAELQAKLNAGVQTIIGGAIARAHIPAGKVVFDAKNDIIADAGRKVANDFGDTLTRLGSKDNIKKATELVENRLGLMQATAEGTPVPNPSAPVAVPVVAEPAPPVVIASSSRR